MASDFTYRADQELPSMAFDWYDRDRALIDFSGGYTFQCELVDIAGAVALTKTTGISGGLASPNVTVTFSTDEISALDGTYQIHLRARDGSNADRFFRPTQWPTIQVIGAPS